MAQRLVKLAEIYYLCTCKNKTCSCFESRHTLFAACEDALHVALAKIKRALGT